jgi:hypothetical protein
MDVNGEESDSVGWVEGRGGEAEEDLLLWFIF